MVVGLQTLLTSLCKSEIIGEHQVPGLGFNILLRMQQSLGQTSNINETHLRFSKLQFHFPRSPVTTYAFIACFLYALCVLVEGSLVDQSSDQVYVHEAGG